MQNIDVSSLKYILAKVNKFEIFVLSKDADVFVCIKTNFTEQYDYVAKKYKKK